MCHTDGMRGSNMAPRRSLARQARTFAIFAVVATALFACEFVTHAPDFESAAPGDCPGATKCGDTCVNLDSDPAHCGACGTACPADGFCVSGTCMAQCPAPGVVCGGKCVDVLTDPNNCSICGMACSTDLFCSQGACKPCPLGTSACGKGDLRRCVDLRSDPGNCGACAAAGNGSDTGKCPAGKPLCVNRVCSANCPSPLVVCGVACVDTTSDPAHCGSCTQDCTAGDSTGTHPSTHLCNDNQCVTVCGQGLTTCGTTCADVQTDPKNCGRCGNFCVAASGTVPPTCALGACCTTALGCK
jgi:hypothetical protein